MNGELKIDFFRDGRRVEGSQAEEHEKIRAALLFNYNIMFADGHQECELYISDEGNILYPSPESEITWVVPRIGRRTKLQRTFAGDWRARLGKANLGEVVLEINQFPKQDDK